MPLASGQVAVVTGTVVFVAGLLVLRARANRTRNVGRPVFGGPANLRFTCAGCSQKFTHSKRTLAAWGRGTRKFYCKACHTKWCGAHPAKAAQGRSPANLGLPAVGKGSGSGCLGVMILLVAVPAALVYTVSAYV